MRSCRVSLLGAALGLVALACNALLDLDTLTPYDPTEAGTASSGGPGDPLPDTGSPDLDSSAPDGGSSSGGSEGDAGVAPCDPTEHPDPRGNLFVKAGSAGDGRMNNPFGSVASAIDELIATRGADGGPTEDPDGGPPSVPTIYVFGGSYTESRPLVVTGLPAFTIDGAWGGTLTEWTRDCSLQRRGNTVINASGSRGLVIRNVPGPSRIANLALFTNDDGNDPSRIGVQVVGSGPLTLSNTIVVAENAAAGSAASNGVVGEPVCSGAVTAACKTNPAPGAEGPAGGPGTPGTFTEAGFAPGNGVPGTDGKPGELSHPGAREQRQCAISCPAPETDAVTCEPPVLGSVSGPEGNCGCGGGKGGAGGGGPGGGASVALLTSSSVRVEYSILQAKNGGAGHGGGSGAAGSAGLPAAPVAPGTCSAPGGGCCLLDPETNPSCRLAGEMPMSDACWAQPLAIPGPTPTTGSGGGKGGDGGGGAGGPSYTVVLLPGGDAEYVETNRSYGVGGTGSDPAPAGGAATELRVTTQ